MTNSKQKGSRGERECRDKFRQHGFENAFRSQQFSGKGVSSADVEGIPGLHIECKVGYRYDTIYKFRQQAESDCDDGRLPVVCCKMDRKKWLAVLDLDDFIELWKEAKGCR